MTDNGSFDRNYLHEKSTKFDVAHTPTQQVVGLTGCRTNVAKPQDTTQRTCRKHQSRNQEDGDSGMKESRLADLALPICTQTYLQQKTHPQNK
jgi:hypothetical protein